MVSGPPTICSDTLLLRRWVRLNEHLAEALDGWNATDFFRQEWHLNNVEVLAI